MSKVLDLWTGMTGVMFPYAGTSAPSGWLMCYGQAVSRTTYAVLFSVIGTTYGAGDGSTTFNLPDARGRVVAGRDNMGGTASNRLTSAVSGVDGVTLGASGGSQSHQLSVPQMPQHSHAVTDPTHTHAVYDPGHSHTQQSWNLSSFDNTGGLYQVGADAPASGSLGIINSVSHVASGISNYSTATGISIQNSGAGQQHNNTQPTIIVNQIIKI